MSDLPLPSQPSCPMEADVVALARGELLPAEEAPVRAHLASCPPCALLAGDVARLRTVAAARPSPVPDAASRARLLAALDATWSEAEEEEAARLRARGPALRLLDQAGRRYAESRGFRFLTFSVAAHAAAAVALAIHLVGGGGSPGEAEPLTIAQVAPLPPPYPEDPLRAPVPRNPLLAEGAPPPPLEVGALPFPGAGIPWQELPPVLQDPEEFAATLRLYPTAEFSSFATARFRTDLRLRRLARAWGEEQVAGVRQSVDMSLRMLAGMQEADGTWASGRPGDPKAQRDRFRGGVTGVVLGAFLADGRTPMQQGAFSTTVKDALGALVRSQDGRGLLGAFAAGVANDRPLCNHGPALAALSEAYGLDYRFLTPEMKRDLASVIEKGLAATLRAQLADGSFGYEPGARAGDASVTLLQVEAMEAARMAGFEVDGGAFHRAAAWLLRRIGADGRLGYRTSGDRAGDATLTSGALALGKVLELPADLRERMLAEVVREARATDMGSRVLFRSSLLETLAGDDASREGSPATALVRGTLRSQVPGGSFPAEPDVWARAAGDALSTARTVRALTAPYRTSAP